MIKLRSGRMEYQRVWLEYMGEGEGSTWEKGGGGRGSIPGRRGGGGEVYLGEGGEGKYLREVGSIFRFGITYMVSFRIGL